MNPVKALALIQDEFKSWQEQGCPNKPSGQKITSEQQKAIQRTMNAFYRNVFSREPLSGNLEGERADVFALKPTRYGLDSKPAAIMVPADYTPLTEEKDGERIERAMAVGHSRVLLATESNGLMIRTGKDTLSSDNLLPEDFRDGMADAGDKYDEGVSGRRNGLSSPSL